jgi:hypothetical protein
MTNEEARTANKVLPKAGLNGFDWAFEQSSTFVLRLNFCAKNPRPRQYSTVGSKAIGRTHRRH